LRARFAVSVLGARAARRSRSALGTRGALRAFTTRRAIRTDGALSVVTTRSSLGTRRAVTFLRRRTAGRALRTVTTAFALVTISITAGATALGRVGHDNVRTLLGRRYQLETLVAWIEG
jgi:hypothetical protein